jgi:GNAT superfamily N-acetyltransferase
MAKAKVRRTSREELPGVALLREAVADSLPSARGRSRVLDLDMEVDPDLVHLMTHDPDGFLTALDREETLGFAAAHVRSKQWVLSELLVLPQHQGQGAGEALLSRSLAYGERSGAREYLALVPTGGAIQSLLLRHDFKPHAVVYRLRIGCPQAAHLGPTLEQLLQGHNVTAELLSRRGQADLDRIDRLTRGITREVDHDYWLKTRELNAAFVRQGARIAAYAIGGPDTVGPVAGATQESAMAALGWALGLAQRHTVGPSLDVLVPAPFVPAVDALLESEARLEATLMLYGRGLSAGFDRSAFASTSLP